MKRCAWGGWELERWWIHGLDHAGMSNEAVTVDQLVGKRYTVEHKRDIWTALALLYCAYNAVRCSNRVVVVFFSFAMLTRKSNLVALDYSFSACRFRVAALGILEHEEH